VTANFPKKKPETTAYERVIVALEAAGCEGDPDRGMWQCPAHPDRTPSLHVDDDDENGKVLLHCHAGCSTAEVVKALGLKMADLFDANGGRPLGEEVAYWRYVDEERHELYQVVKFEPKTFRPRRKVNGEWVWNLNGTRRVLYRLPEVIRAVASGKTVFVTEGEKDADRLRKMKLVATTNQGGCGGKWLPEYTETLRGANVVLTADNDDPEEQQDGTNPGVNRVRRIAPELEGVTASVEVLMPPTVGHDISDHLDAGLTLEDLVPVEMPDEDIVDVAEPKHPDQYFTRDGFVPPLLGKKAEEVGLLRRGPGGEIYRYVDGAYKADGKDWLAQFVRDELDDEFRKHRLGEVEGWVQANTANTIPIDPSMEYVNVKNGLLFWQEDPPELRPHDPGVPSIIQIPIDWDPSVRCPAIKGFLVEALPDPKCVEFLMEWFGYLLFPKDRFQKSLMLSGPTATGKSRLLLLIGAFLGKDNVSHATLHALTEDRFMNAELFGKLANVAADIDARAIRSAGLFKMLAAGDPITAQRKYGQPFQFVSFARLVFSANELPGTTDQSSAFYRRWGILPMTNAVSEDRQDARLIDRLTTPEELSGLLNLAVEGLRRLMKRGRFNIPAVMSEALDQYKLATDTVTGFIEDRYTVTGNRRARVRRGQMYEEYDRWCSKNGKFVLSAPKFKEQLLATYPKVREVKLRGEWFFAGMERQGLGSLHRVDEETP
jgi:putative DNA primase/helicase